ncbi:hypothetical protein WJX72_007274 [[Myrmecia] bisecta]|uniref:DUF1995 domain-containing protein n=1 Tax=[Myrmecia] bisecta TaxID=41462 RepID=A0AAW1Q2F6_9CHLO
MLANTVSRSGCCQTESRTLEHRSLSSSEEVTPAEQPEPAEASADPRDDDVLPDNLTDALAQASEATAKALERGAGRCIVELLLPEFWDPNSGAVFAEEGDQQRFWKLTRRFVEQMAEQSGRSHVRAVYPDIGVAAMLKNQWQDVTFHLSSLNDRKVFSEEDDLIVIAAPDPQGLQDVVRVSQQAEGSKPVVLFNPRLASGDAGIGLNVRRMRDRFLSTFVTTYSLRPIGDAGSVFRRYPSLWQVFMEDPSMPGRYKLAAERAERPAGDALDLILTEASGAELNADGEPGSGPGLLTQLGSTMASLQRFARSLSR